MRQYLDGSGWSLTLKIEGMSAQSQSDGREEDLGDCVKMIWRMGAQVLRKKGGILSGPVDLLVSGDSRRFWIPSVLMSRLVHV